MHLAFKEQASNKSIYICRYGCTICSLADLRYNWLYGIEQSQFFFPRWLNSILYVYMQNYKNVCYVHVIYTSICMHITLYVYVHGCSHMTIVLTYTCIFMCVWMCVINTHTDTQTHIHMYVMVSSNQNNTLVIL